jgi:hypothetical protein
MAVRETWQPSAGGSEQVYSGSSDCILAKRIAGRNDRVARCASREKIARASC